MKFQQCIYRYTTSSTNLLFIFHFPLFVTIFHKNKFRIKEFIIHEKLRPNYCEKRSAQDFMNSEHYMYRNKILHIFLLHVFLLFVCYFYLCVYRLTAISLKSCIFWYLTNRISFSRNASAIFSRKSVASCDRHCSSALFAANSTSKSTRFLKKYVQYPHNKVFCIDMSEQFCQLYMYIYTDQWDSSYSGL